uniref:Methyltransferase small domain-containing protein n=1 Tax=Spongospora subterranea TaxID=70186 RepID=A0A0H5QYG6_9EUKA|eukprot:CRZ00619.1 hypothetical protein [Spongospora subterranea]
MGGVGFFLAEYCLMSSIVSGKRCLELGCGGTGVVSTICSRMDPRAYMATDYNDEVLEKLSSNLVDNNVHEVMVRRLDWFDVDDAILAESAPELILLSDTVRE